jgi:hypothetical protein
MIDDTAGQERADRPLRSSLERCLQDKGKGRRVKGGNYRRNAAHELERSVGWTPASAATTTRPGSVPLTPTENRPSGSRLHQSAHVDSDG